MSRFRRKKKFDPKPDPRRRLIPGSLKAKAEGCPCEQVAGFEDWEEGLYACKSDCPIHGFEPRYVKPPGG